MGAMAFAGKAIAPMGRSYRFCSRAKGAQRTGKSYAMPGSGSGFSV